MPRTPTTSRRRNRTAPTVIPAPPPPPPITPEHERFDRFRGLVDPVALLSIGALVVGCGAIGRQVALSLASMGIGGISLCDRDIVSEVNMGTQGWSPEQAGAFKVNALAQELTKINPSLMYGRHQQAHNYLSGASIYHPAVESGVNRVVFMCVDSLDAREEIFRDMMDTSTAENPTFGLMVDGRMGAETCEIHYAMPSRESCQAYLATIHGGPPVAEVSCTARSTYYCAGIAANLMVSCMVRWLRGDIMPPQIQLHIPTFSINQISPPQMVPEAFRPVYIPSDAPAPDTQP